VLVQGVRLDESPLNTVSWTIIGWPLTTVAMPLVLTTSGELPAIVTNDGTGHSRLNELGLKLKKLVFSLERGNVEFYGDLSKLMNKKGTGILQRILPIENEVMHLGEEALTGYRKSQDANVMQRYYDWVDAYIVGQYKNVFGIE
jgi:hypothetical protein